MSSYSDTSASTVKAKIDEKRIYTVSTLDLEIIVCCNYSSEFASPFVGWLKSWTKSRLWSSMYEDFPILVRVHRM